MLCAAGRRVTGAAPPLAEMCNHGRMVVSGVAAAYVHLVMWGRTPTGRPRMTHCCAVSVLMHLGNGRGECAS